MEDVLARPMEMNTANVGLRIRLLYRFGFTAEHLAYLLDYPNWPMTPADVAVMAADQPGRYSANALHGNVLHFTATTAEWLERVYGHKDAVALLMDGMRVGARHNYAEFIHRRQFDVLQAALAMLDT